MPPAPVMCGRAVPPGARIEPSRYRDLL